MDIKKLVRIADDAKSDKRFDDLWEKHRYDTRYWVNQIQRCSEDKRVERLATWIPRLEDENDYASKNILRDLENKFPYEFKTAKEDIKDDPYKHSEIGRSKHNAKVEAEEKAKQEAEAKRKAEEEDIKNNGKHLDDKIENVICDLIFNIIPMRELVRSNHKWNSFGGRIGNYSHQWVKANGAGIKYPENYIRDLDRSYNCWSKIIWYGDYNYDFGIDYKSGSTWIKGAYEGYKKVNRYDSDEFCTIYKLGRCSKANEKKIKQKAVELTKGYNQTEVVKFIDSLIY